MANHKNIAKAASLMLVAILLSRILGLVREIIIAGQFGQGGDVSAYTAAFNLPDLLYFFLSSGALSSAFIPVFTELFQNGKQKEAWQVFSIIASLMGIVLTAIIIIAEIYAPPLVTIFAVPGFAAKNPDLVPITIALTRIIMPCQLFFFMGGIMMGTLEARQKFDARAAGPVIYNLGIIAGAILFGHWVGIKGLAFGTLIGAFVGNIVYTYYCLKKEGFEYKFSLNLKHSGVIKVAVLALPVILGLSLPQINVIINKLFASWISESAPAALNYANRLMQLPLGIFAQAAGTAILPALSSYAAAKEFDKMKSAIGYGIKTIMIENIPATIFMAIMADPLVRTIYMSNAFTSADVPITAIALTFYSLGIFAWAGQAIVARGFFAIQNTMTPVIIGTISTLIFIPLNFIFLKTLGNGGLALSTTVAVIINFLALTVCLKKRLGGIDGANIFRTLKKIFIATAVMTIVCFGVKYAGYELLGTWQLQNGDIKSPEKLAFLITSSNDIKNQNIKAYISKDTRLNALRYNKYEDIQNDLNKDICNYLNELLKSNAFGKKNIIDNRKAVDKIFASSLKGFKSSTSPMANMILGKENATKMLSDPSGLYKPSDILNTSAFLNDAQEGKSEVEKTIRNGLSNSLKGKISVYEVLANDIITLPDNLRKDLNDFIINHNTKENINKNTISQKHNRQLLSEIYPDYVKIRPCMRIESKMGSLITVTIALILCGGVYFFILKKLKVEEVEDIIAHIMRKKKKKQTDI